jgi:hypothetical protein
MRKRDPNAVVSQFQSELASSLADLTSIHGKVGESGKLAQRASMDAFTRAAVAFEGFRSNWHIAAISRDATAFNKSQRNRVVAALTETDRGVLTAYVPSLALPLHPKLDEIGEILDPDRGNVSIKTLQDWQDKAGRHLCDPWKSKVTGLGYGERTLMAAVVALRNAAAHQSSRSADEMKTALGALTTPDNAGLRLPGRGITVSGIPTYLNGFEVGQERRVRKYHSRLHALAQRLRVP